MIKCLQWEGKNQFSVDFTNIFTTQNELAQENEIGKKIANIQSTFFQSGSSHGREKNREKKGENKESSKLQHGDTGVGKEENNKQENEIDTHFCSVFRASLLVCKN